MDKLNFIGLGGATNIELGGNCCYLKNKNDLLIIDACESATEKLKNIDAFDKVKNIYIIITHTHFDHIAGLGVLIWYCKFYLHITPHIVYKTEKYKYTLKKILKLTGVNTDYIQFLKDKDFKIDDLTLQLEKTTHAKSLQCFGIMFKDNNGKYYYTSDTNDIEYIKELCNNPSVKKIYTEVSTESFGIHIKYEDLVNLKSDKLVLMHFNTMDLYNRAIKDGLNIGDKVLKLKK